MAVWFQQGASGDRRLLLAVLPMAVTSARICQMNMLIDMIHPQPDEMVVLASGETLLRQLDLVGSVR